MSPYRTPQNSGGSVRGNRSFRRKKANDSIIGGQAKVSVVSVRPLLAYESAGKWFQLDGHRIRCITRAGDPKADITGSSGSNTRIPVNQVTVHSWLCSRMRRPLLLAGPQ